MDIIRIKCFDASFHSGSWDRNGIKTGFGLIGLDIVGWLVEDRKDCIIVASEYDPEDDRFRHLQAIPKVCIVSQSCIGRER